MNFKLIGKVIKATKEDVPYILDFIKRLAVYEKLESDVVVTEELLLENLFGKNPFAQVLFYEVNSKKVGFALYFFNFSTFLGRPGIYLEDLFILPEFRNRGYGKKLLIYLAKLTIENGFGRLEWSVLNWNKPALEFYKKINSIPMTEWTAQRLTGKPLEDLASSK